MSKPAEPFIFFGNNLPLFCIIVGLTIDMLVIVIMAFVTIVRTKPDAHGHSYLTLQLNGKEVKAEEERRRWWSSFLPSASLALLTLLA